MLVCGFHHAKPEEGGPPPAQLLVVSAGILRGWRRGVLEQPRYRTLHGVRLLLGATDGVTLTRVLERDDLGRRRLRLKCCDPLASLRG